MIINMVVGFYFNEDLTKVLLVEKKSPKWQKGLLNGIGGKCDNGEFPNDAIVREFKEEVGIDVDILHWKQFCLLHLSGNNWRVHFYKSIGSFDNINDKNDVGENIRICKVNDLYKFPVIENLRWLIPMCFDRQLQFVRAYNHS